MCDALPEARSIEIGKPELPPEPVARDSALIDYRGEHLELECVPLGRNDEERFQVNTAIAVARALKLDPEVG